MAGNRARAARPGSRAPSRNLLRSQALAEALVADAGIGPPDLVLDIGAGTGRLTDALARRARRVWAIESDSGRAALLRTRYEAVVVVEADATTLTLPREPFKVVANLPFDRTTEILRHVLDPRGALVAADVVVQWDVAAKRASVWPSTLLSAYWGAWFELSLRRRIDRSAFDPAPAVDGGVLRVVRRAVPLVPPAEHERYGAFVRAGFGRRAAPRELHSLANELGVSRHARPRDLDARSWAALYRFVHCPG